MIKHIRVELPRTEYRDSGATQVDPGIRADPTPVSLIFARSRTTAASLLSVLSATFPFPNSSELRTRPQNTVNQNDVQQDAAYGPRVQAQR